MSNLSRTEPKLTADAAIARFINEDPADYATEGDSFDVDDVPENCELVGPVSYERDILAGIILARTVRQYKDTLRGYEERLERQAAWGKDQILKIRGLELLVSQLEEKVSDLTDKNDYLTKDNRNLKNQNQEEIKARLDTQVKLNEKNTDFNIQTVTVMNAVQQLTGVLIALKGLAR